MSVLQAVGHMEGGLPHRGHNWQLSYMSHNVCYIQSRSVWFVPLCLPTQCYVFKPTSKFAHGYAGIKSELDVNGVTTRFS